MRNPFRWQFSRRARVAPSRIIDVAWLPLTLMGILTAAWLSFRIPTSLAPTASAPRGNQVQAFAAAAREAPTIRKVPRAVVATSRFQPCIDQRVLRQILRKLEPRSAQSRPGVAMATHALRLWGATADFAEGPYVPPDCHFTVWRYSGPTLLQFLASHKSFARYFPDAEPLLQPTEQGIAVRFKPATPLNAPVDTLPDCEAHIDKVLSVFAELGLESDFPITAPERRGSIRDLLGDATARFVLEQELEFSTKAFLYYLELPAKWSNRHGRRVDLNAILQTLAHRDLGEGACTGTHLCQTIALALAIDSREPFLGPDGQTLYDCLREISARLERSQEPSGAWSVDWPMSGIGRQLVESEGAAGARLRVTGHHLEWIAIAPASVCPADDAVLRAIRFLQETLAELPGDSYHHHYTALTHAGRALLILSGVHANSQWLAEE